MAKTERVVLGYDGGLATDGRMLLYEYGRSQYAFSRLITTVERFRRSNKVIDKVTRTQRIDLTVSTPRKGSFQLDVDVDVDQNSAPGNPDFEVLLALVLDRLVPPGEEFNDLSIALAKIKLVELASIPDPKFSGEHRDLLEGMAKGEVHSDLLMLNLLEWAINSSNRAIARADITQDEIERAYKIVKGDLLRRQLIESRSASLPDIPDLDKLAAKVRPMFGELAVALGRSAETIDIGNGSTRGSYYIFDRKRLRYIEERKLDQTEEQIDGKMKNFDIESGYGSFRSSKFSGIRRFGIDSAVGDALKFKVVLAMNQSSVTLTCAKYTDSNGVVTSYLLRDIAW